MKYKIKTWDDRHKNYPICVFAWLPIITDDGFLIWWEYCWKYIWLRPDEYGGTAYLYNLHRDIAEKMQAQYMA